MIGRVIIIDKQTQISMIIVENEKKKRGRTQLWLIFQVETSRSVLPIFNLGHDC